MLERSMGEGDADGVWIPGAAAPPLSGAAAHIWRAALDLRPEATARLQELLSADEQARANRYRFARDRLRFIAARGTLRLLLGQYLRLPPDQVRFCYNPYGKPALAPNQNPDSLCFNISHSHGLALYALTTGRQIGVDIEYIRPDLAVEEIAERFFSPAEVTMLRALPVEHRGAAFMAGWTRKEAYIKGHGAGLTIPLDQFDVTLAPGVPAALLSTRHDPPEAARWRLADLSMAPDFAAAVAVAGQGGHLSCWHWPESSDIDPK